MTTKTPELPKASVKMIALSKLIPSKQNVRRAHSKAGIEQLATSIMNNGLLQNLVVQIGRSEFLEVTAGARRLAALRLLAKKGTIKKDYAVPCQFREAEEATEVSLSENFQRENMHPADEVEAFAKLNRDMNLSPEEIANRFGISHMSVRRRLKLACISPKIMRLFREGEATLEQMQALALTEDQSLQEQIFIGVEEWERRPDNIKRKLAQDGIAATSRLARFITLEAYEAAGGEVIRDLFDDRNSGYLKDTKLVSELAEAKLKEAVKAYEGQGWKWIMTSSENQHFDFGHEQPEVAFSKKDQKRAEKIGSRLEDLHLASEAEDFEDNGEIEKLEAQLTELEHVNAHYGDEQKARSGVLATISHDGSLNIELGMVHPDDKKAQQREVKAREALERGNKDEAPSDVLSRAVIEDLSKVRTAGLAVMLADTPAIALRLAAYRLACDHMFHIPDYQTAVKVKASKVNLVQSDEENNLGFEHLQQRQRVMARQLPSNKVDLWDWLLGVSTDKVQEVIALCMALSLDVVQASGSLMNEERFAEAGLIAKALNFDMSQWWKPSVSFFKRVSKAFAKSVLIENHIASQIVDGLDKLKKADSAKLTAEALAHVSWVPAPIASFPAMRVQPETNVEDDAQDKHELAANMEVAA